MVFVLNTQCQTRQKKYDVSERHNQTLMDMVRSMLNNSYVLILLWMYALKVVMYLFNRVPSKVF